ncbi:hypothetical protein HYPSUDRAFT_656867 [Hypholoma sublateritium FD-334 SS-4]|uniref:F-box domain-containing protein n=1 Tax=Hypholoma sublateritium (strain FD-334 SS-4) TaxID=945553 RepID=A0A0D2P129_HYPSF|nr:hypothetical protein HYPSUDRAFT_656867 [Hypholoma sublateritium FD-334 SS-4]
MASLAHLCTSNQAPTDDERARLKETVADYDEKLAAITQKISALEVQLRSLNEEKTATLEASKLFKRALSPFRQLPEDVVRAIFVACLEWRCNPTMAKTEAPVLLTRISRATRMIALTTPRLWAAIHIPIITSVQLEVMDTAKSVMNARARGVKEWLLRRSGDLPLRISVYETNYNGTQELTSDVIDILIACCSRWKNVHFTCRPTTLSGVLSLSRFDVPLLQSLAMYPTTFTPDEINLWKNSDILQSPMLKKFGYLGFSNGVPPKYPVNWSNLTHLHCTDAMDNLVDVLRQAAALTTLNLTLERLEHAIPYSGTISLPCLTSLVIIQHCRPRGENMEILESIYAPSLEAVCYDSMLDPPPRSPALIACLKRSPNVRELSMTRPSSADTLVEYLRHCPALLTLRVPPEDLMITMEKLENPWSKADTDTFLRAFFQDDAAQCLCPQLEYFRYEAELVVSLRTLHDFLVHRKGGNPHLSSWKAVTLNVEYDPVEEPLIKEIESAEVAGNTRLMISFQKRMSRWENLGFKQLLPDLTYWRRLDVGHAQSSMI